jgi:hypothetical protein
VHPVGRWEPTLWPFVAHTSSAPSSPRLRLNLAESKLKDFWVPSTLCDNRKNRYQIYQKYATWNFSVFMWENASHLIYQNWQTLCQSWRPEICPNMSNCIKIIHHIICQNMWQARWCNLWENICQDIRICVRINERDVYMTVGIGEVE